MSRALSARAMRAFFSPDCEENVITLLKIYGANMPEPIYLADGYTKRLDALTGSEEWAGSSRPRDLYCIVLYYMVAITQRRRPSDDPSFRGGPTSPQDATLTRRGRTGPT